MRAGGPGALAGARVGQHVSAVDGRLLGDTDEEQAGEARLASALPGERVSLEVLFAATACCALAVRRAARAQRAIHAVQACGVQNATFTLRRAACSTGDISPCSLVSTRARYGESTRRCARHG